MQMQAMLLSVQKTVVEGKVYAKAFIALPANNETEAVSSVMQLTIPDTLIDQIMREVIASDIKLGELCNITLEMERGGKNSLKQIIVGIASAQRPGHKPQPQNQENKG
ncbi:MAG: hypothetical protein GXZ05_08165 [Gammaproteobacteria bacterium]|nr:hypothetical protein [Gammaproteobacteria bacterium]